MSANNININLPRNLNRSNTNHSEFEEEVNTTMSKFSNNKTDQINPHEFDNLSLASSAQYNNKKKDNLKSSDNLTQVNQMYATKKPSKKNNQPDELKKDLKAKNNQNDIEISNNNNDENNNNNESAEEYIDPDLMIREYIQQKNFEIKGEDMLFCVCVDGAQHSEFAFEITIQDLIKNNDKLFAVHIFNSKMDEYFNFRNKKDTIIEKYNTAVLRIDKSRVLFLKEDRTSKIHPMEQVHRISVNHKCNYLVCGYWGMRLQKGDNKELAKGIDYLLNYAKTPTIIIKENKLRKNRPNGKLKWLFVFDRAYINCYNIFEKFLPLINTEKDLVFGYTMLPPWVNFDDVNRNFNLDMENYKINNYDYEVVEYKKNPSELVKEKVNFGDIQFDFMVFYNNPEKHKSAGKDSDCVNFITKCYANLCFINGQ